MKSESDSEEDIKPSAKRQSLGAGKAAKKPNYLESSEESGEMEVKPSVVKKGKGNGKAVKREPSVSLGLNVR